MRGAPHVVGDMLAVVLGLAVEDLLPYEAELERDGLIDAVADVEPVLLGEAVLDGETVDDREAETEAVPESVEDTV